MDPDRSTLPYVPGSLASTQTAGGPRTFGRYQVIRQVGAGGMGTVFEGFDPALNRRVALKAIKTALSQSPDLRENFFREARAAAAVASDFIVTVFDVGEDNGLPFIAMEYLEGYSLQVVLNRLWPLPYAWSSLIGLQVAEGLERAHQHGLVHRDIKPANIWMRLLQKDPANRPRWMYDVALELAAISERFQGRQLSPREMVEFKKRLSGSESLADLLALPDEPKKKRRWWRRRG